MGKINIRTATFPTPENLPFSGIAMFFITLSFVAALILRILLAFTHYWDLGGVEPDEIYTLQRALAGYPIYENPGLPPFSITQKTPLYHYLCLIMGKWSGVDPDNPYGVMLLNRFVSLGLSLCSLILAFIIQVKLLDVPVKYALPICFLAFVCFEPHMFCRPDSLYSFLFMATIASFIACLGGGTKYSGLFLMLSSVLAILTIFAKQSGIVLPPLILGYLVLFEKNRGKAALGAALMFCAFAILFFLLKGDSAATFIANVYKGLKNGIDLDWFHRFIICKSYQRFGIAMAIGLSIGLIWVWFRPGTRQSRFLGWTLLVTFAFANVTGLKSGSTPSYFTEFVNITLISAPYFFREFLIKRLGAGALEFKILIFFLAMALLVSNLSDKNYFVPFHQQDKSLFEKAEQVKRYVEEVRGLPHGAWMLTDEPLLKLYFYEYALFPQYDIVHCCAFPLKIFDYAQFYKLVEEGKAPYLITRQDLQGLDFLGQSLGEYSFLEARAGFNIYVYKQQ